MASDYDWHPDATNGGSVFKVETRNLGWWIFLAILVSVGIHIIIYVVLDSWEHTEDSKEEILNFRLTGKQETIDRKRLDELLAQNEVELPKEVDIVEPGDLSEIDVTKDFDDFELYDKMKDMPIRMAPVDSPEIYAPAMPKAPPASLKATSEQMDLSTAESLSKDLDSMRNRLVEDSNRVAAEQPTLQVDTSDIGKGLDTDEFFKNAAKSAMGGDADEFVKGYSSLDDLISTAGGIKKGSQITALLPSDILFEYGKDELAESARLAMIKLAYLIETNPKATFIIEGHTDGFGGDEYNRRLSLNRAKAVKDWLVRELSINPANVQVVGKGKSEPLVDVEGDAESQALNRRVEIEIRR